MNWTIGEDRFRLCSFLGGFLQIVTLTNAGNFVNQKICPQNGHADEGLTTYVVDDFELTGRGERIRTSDLTVPNRALYQAEPRPDI